MEESNIITSETTVIKTDVDSINGQNKCPKCGATDISLNVNSGHLRCNYCRYEFALEQVSGFDEDISKLTGTIMGSGAQDIVADTNDIVTFKCSSCGAEVVIDTASSTQARCHWCRNTLSVNQQIPNGMIPDVVLPFHVSKEQAKEKIEEFVGKRKFYAHPKFKKEFTTNNIMGVYFPYMVIDINSHVSLTGEGEHLSRQYTVTNGDSHETRYDADLYSVQREFDLAIDDLTIESSLDKLNNNNENKTNNIINSIMPFDTEHCVKYNSNYLKGYTSEKRDTNITQLESLVETQAKDVARFAANDTLKHYDRGVCWENENLDIIGQQWKAAYLPVWLYSYKEDNGKLHYVAVNARTKETMGSVPIYMPKLIGFSFLVELSGFFAMVKIEFEYDWVFLSVGLIYFLVIYSKYRNNGARHTYEKETKTKMSNLKSEDTFIKKRTGLSNSKISGANNLNVRGSNTSSFVDSLKNK